MDKVDVVIPIHDVSRINHIDLIFTLRSIEKNLKNHNNVYLVGEKIPNFIKKTINIPFKQSNNDNNKQINILNKILFCCNIDKLSEEFIFMNDDHILLREFDAITFPKYQDGEMERNVSDNPYKFTVNNTLRFLENNNSTKLNFDIHTPILYNKKKFKKIFETIKFPNFGYCIKSIYGNLAKVKPTYLEDCKITYKLTKEQAQEICKDKTIISFTDAPIKTGLKEYLKELFPNKSKFEL